MYAPQTILWYDLETFGTHSRYDRIAQFAAVRTNTDLEIIDDPIMIYCRITPDYLPDPLACLITGITPQETLEKGLCEAEFSDRILQEFLKPGTCVAGYNSIRFDDEFIRNLLYRNFHDPYSREYVNGNSRWDILDLLRAAHDLRPEGILWPRREDGRPSFRLEHITRENSIEHEHAHDALADVYATISAARLVREHQKDLYEFAFSHRRKSALKQLVNLHDQKPFLHTSAFYTSEQGCTALLMPISADPHNSNAILCFDLMNDPEELIEISPELLKDTPLLTRLHLNKCPFISPSSVLTEEIAQRIGIDKERCRKHYSRIRERKDLNRKVFAAFSAAYGENPTDPDFQIYSGGFFSDSDRERFSLIRSCSPEELPGLNLRFEDPRVPEMLWRYIARNYPDVLDEKDLEKWKSFCASRLLFPPGDIMISYQFYTRKIAEKAASKEMSAEDKIILQQLSEYGSMISRRILKTV